MKQQYTGKLGARDYKTNQRELYIRRFTMRQTDVYFYILFDEKPFVAVRRDFPMPATFAFKVAYTLLFYCIGQRSRIWDELAVEPLKDVAAMHAVKYGINNRSNRLNGLRVNEPAQLDLEEILGHA